MRARTEEPCKKRIKINKKRRIINPILLYTEAMSDRTRLRFFVQLSPSRLWIFYTCVMTPLLLLFLN